MGELKLESTAFSDEEEIPRKYGYKNGNVAISRRIADRWRLIGAGIIG